MKQYIQIYCPHCEHDDLVKNGHSENGTQRSVCNGCHRNFQWEYTHRAWIPEVKEQIETQTLNGSGVRDISRNLGISKTTVLAELKKKRRLTCWRFFLSRRLIPIIGKATRSSSRRTGIILAKSIRGKLNAQT